MLKNLLVIALLCAFITAACVKSSVETNAADNSANGQKSFGAGVEANNSAAKTSEKVSAENAKIFRGMINGIAFEMRLARSGNQLSGTYFYTKVGKDLKLSGSIDTAGKFTLKETDQSGKTTGDWEGTWKEDKNDNGIALEGFWKKPTETKDQAFSFYATEQIIEFANGAKLIDKTIRDDNKAKRSENFSRYPELTGINSASEKSFNGTVKSLVDKANDDYKKFLLDMSDEDIKSLPSEMKLDHQFDYDVVLANDDLVSLTLTNYVFEGGAHGSTDISSLNYDLKNNRELKLADIFEPNSNYLKIIADYSIADLKPRIGEMSDEEWLKKGAEANEENYATWNLTKKGLMITFNAYQVAAYAAGPQTVIVPYDKLKPVLRKDGVWTSLLK